MKKFSQVLHSRLKEANITSKKQPTFEQPRLPTTAKPVLPTWAILRLSYTHNPAALSEEIASWQSDRNSRKASVNWRFKITDARKKMGRLYLGFRNFRT